MRENSAINGITGNVVIPINLGHQRRIEEVIVNWFTVDGLRLQVFTVFTFT